MFFRRSGGYIKYFGLKKWWYKSFSKGERAYIEDKYRPMGSVELNEGRIESTSQSVIGFINSLITYFSYKSDFSILKKIIEMADSRYNEANIEEKHLYLLFKADFYYRNRKRDEINRKEYLKHAEKQVDISKQASKFFKKEYGKPLPTHGGYSYLIDYYQQNDEIEKAINLCELAQNEGWSGNWEERKNKIS